MKSFSSLLVLTVCLLLGACQSKMEKLKSEMLDQPAPKFTMTDLKGNEISLDSLKGKTVIMDFWATWCGPCKESFPEMQKVVNKYQDNPNVVFFFVNTWEKGKTLEQRKKEISQFIEKNEYSFHILLDRPIKTATGEPIKNILESYKIAKRYEIGSIPTKIVIGPLGNIKFNKSGSDGTADEIFREIEMMLQLIKSSSAVETN